MKWKSLRWLAARGTDNIIAQIATAMVFHNYHIRERMRGEEDYDPVAYAATVATQFNGEVRVYCVCCMLRGCCQRVLHARTRVSKDLGGRAGA